VARSVLVDVPVPVFELLGEFFLRKYTAGKGHL